MRPIRTTSTASLALLGLVLAAAGLACGGREPEPAERDTGAPVEQGVRFVGAELGRAVGGDRAITDATDEFGPNDTIYLSVETEGYAPRTTLAARWTYQDGQEVDRSEITIAPSGQEHTEFHVSKPDGWPAGDYQVEITLDGRSVETLDFEVEG